MDERKRDSMIAYLRHRMEEFGIKPEDLAALLASEPAAQKNARYRSATGDSWDGQGKCPNGSSRQSAQANQSTILNYRLRPHPRRSRKSASTGRTIHLQAVRSRARTSTERPAPRYRYTLQVGQTGRSTSACTAGRRRSRQQRILRRFNKGA